MDCKGVLIKERPKGEKEVSIMRTRAVSEGVIWNGNVDGWVSKEEGVAWDSSCDYIVGQVEERRD